MVTLSPGDVHECDIPLNDEFNDLLLPIGSAVKMVVSRNVNIYECIRTRAPNHIRETGTFSIRYLCDYTVNILKQTRATRDGVRKLSY